MAIVERGIMSIEKSLKNLKFDKRMIQWNINNKQLTQEELKKHLESLPDLGHQVDLINLESSNDENQSQH